MSTKQYFGVGFGPALASRKIGFLPKAIAELQSLIQDGADPRYLTIVPVRRCTYCRGRGYFLNALVEMECIDCSGFKWLVDRPASLGCRRHNIDLRAALENTGRATI